MARLIHQHIYPTLPTTRPIDLGRVLLFLMQFAVLGGIALLIVLAIANTILGTPQPETVYSPYE